ncbi:MAG: hypothetical protein RQ982_06880 [Gammaproteobacteria bacterium]|nr:hypothetical protein [Gammaproteobacteria bacterium]
MTVIINSPLEVKASRQNFILNLNRYRNTHHQILHRAKINYKSIIEKQIRSLKVMDKIELTFVLFPKTKRLTDLSNVLSIHDKFFCDALVELGKLPDDNYQHITNIKYMFGEVDRINPRVEIYIND